MARYNYPLSDQKLGHQAEVFSPQGRMATKTLFPSYLPPIKRRPGRQEKKGWRGGSRHSCAEGGESFKLHFKMWYHMLGTILFLNLIVKYQTMGYLVNFLQWTGLLFMSSIIYDLNNWYSCFLFVYAFLHVANIRLWKIKWWFLILIKLTLNFFTADQI